MSLSKLGSISVLFGALALAGCQYTIGEGVGTLTTDLSCHSDVLDQTMMLKKGETIYKYKTNKGAGEPYYGVSRDSEKTTTDKAVTTTVKTHTEIKMYDHDRWQCQSADGQAIDYKTLPGVK